MFEINQENRNDLREAMQVSLSSLVNRSNLVNESFSEFVNESATYEQLLNLTFTDRQDSSYTDSEVLESKVFELMDNMTNGKLSVVESYDDASEYLSVLTEQEPTGPWNRKPPKEKKSPQTTRTPSAASDEVRRDTARYMAAAAAARAKGEIPPSKAEWNAETRPLSRNASGQVEKGKQAATHFLGTRSGKIAAGAATVAALGTIGYYLYKKFRKSGMSVDKSKVKASGIVKKNKLR